MIIGLALATSAHAAGASDPAVRTRIATDFYQAEPTPFGTLDFYAPTGELIIANLPFFQARCFYDWSHRKIAADVEAIATIEEQADTVRVSSRQNLGPLAIAYRYVLLRHSPVIECRMAVTYNRPIDSVFSETFEIGIFADCAQIVTRDQRLVPADPGITYVADKWTTRACRFQAGRNPITFPGEDNLMGLTLERQVDRWAVTYDLDRDFDHPFFRRWDIVPVYPTYETLATTARLAGTSEEVWFRLAIGTRPPILKRERQPRGFEATMIITEHADCQSTATSKAIAYGSSETMSPIPGRGLLGNGLAWTKSVFRWHTWGSRNGNLGYYGLDRPDFKEVVDSLYVHGVEIALHTPTSLSDSADTVAAALRNMSAWYQTRTWIDHGLDFNKEALSKFGTFPESTAWYLLDTLRANGIAYIWQAIDMPGLGIGGSNLFAPNRPDFYPPILYPQPRLDDTVNRHALYLWPAFPLGNDNDRDNHLSPGAINQLINERGLDILHVYFGAQDSSVSRRRPSLVNWLLRFGTWPFYTWETDPWVDGCFQYIGDRERNGMLNVATLSQFAGYLLQSESVEIKAQGMVARGPLLRNGGSPNQDSIPREYEFLLINHSQRPLTGFALSTAAEDIQAIVLDSLPVANWKPVGDDILFWFDLPADTLLRLRVVAASPSPSETDRLPPASMPNVECGMRDSAHVTPHPALGVAPNPGRPGTTMWEPAPFGWQVTQGTTARIELYTPDGRLVRTLYCSSASAGRHQLRWDGRDRHGHLLPSGIYVCRLTTGKHVAIFKIVLTE